MTCRPLGRVSVVKAMGAGMGTGVEAGCRVAWFALSRKRRRRKGMRRGGQRDTVMNDEFCMARGTLTINRVIAKGCGSV